AHLGMTGARQECRPKARVLIECRCQIQPGSHTPATGTARRGLIMDLTAGKPLAAIVLALLAGSTAVAQIGDEVPPPSYYAASSAIYTGEYRSAARELSRETQRGIHTAQTRWIDSVCYYAMYGEVLYHQGRNVEALAQFDEACQVLLAYPNWMLQVRFKQNPQPDPNRTRRAPMWGRSQLTFVIGQFPNTEQVMVGDLNAAQSLQTRGGN